MGDDWKIYTRTGDKGETSLIGGRRVPKNHIQIEAYGTVDELNAFVGLICEESTDSMTKYALHEVMDRLFTAESLLAEDQEPVSGKSRTSPSLPQLREEDVLFLEGEIDRMNEGLPALSSFILPGGHRLGALCHVARTICRRAERVCLTLSVNQPVNPLVIKYLNRLSDYLFVLARKLTLDNGGAEIKWQARR